MTLFIQTFRYAAEPFIFSNYTAANARELYAVIMKFFIITGCLIFLGITMYIDVFKYFIGQEFYEGLTIVPILLIANLFLGINYNLGFWYKLKEKTNYGAVISISGAVITIVFNVLLIPHLGYMGAAWTTLVCYLSMALINYFTGRKHYRIPYDVRSLLFYIFLSIVLYLVANHFFDDGHVYSYIVRTLFILIFAGIVLIKEKKLIKTFL